MNNQTIECPKCGTQIPLTETLAGPLLDQVRSESKKLIEAANEEAEQAKAAATKERAELATERANMEAEVAEKLAAKRPEFEANIRKIVTAEMSADMKAQETEIVSLRKSRDEAQAAQLAALKAQTEAEKKAASVDLEVAKKVASETATIQADAVKAAHEAEKLNQAALQKKLDDALHQVDEMKRRIEQGSQQLQGQVAELELEEILVAAFPWDDVGEIKTGVRGADVIQRVKASADAIAGTILWERKRAQNWTADWLTKAKQDMQKEKADLVVIVSEVVPKGVELFDCCEDVWVVHPSCVVSVAKALRAGILDTANARRTAEGLKTNAERAFAYLLGPDFARRLKGIAEPFVALQSDLESERRTMTQRWARRQKQIDRVLEAAFGMRGDIEALAGSDLPELEAIEMKALVSSESAEEEVSA